MKELPLAARMLVCAVIAAGAGLVATSLPLHIDQPLLFAAILTLSSVTSVLKATLPLPRSASTMSVSYAVNFASILMLGTAQTMVIAAVSALCRCTFRIREPNQPHRTLFSMATLVISVYAAGITYSALGGSPQLVDLWTGLPAIGLAAAVYFIVNTLLVASAIALSTDTPVAKVWNENFLWSAPGYFAGSGVATAVALLYGVSSQSLIPLAAVPVYVTYLSCRMYLGRIEEEQARVKEVAELNFATIEALAVAIDAKDQTSQSHIRRVQLYATAVARALGMSESHIQGVKTAALLHDIGKLAVPDHILSKPGPLTPGELQKIKAHPKTGADIISGVPFPYPVAPLILSHHERWDGQGYPSGLKGEEIPLGARILAVVDCFDALMDHRPYHGPLPYDAALALIEQEAGQAYDPKVVEAFVGLLPALRLETAKLDQLAIPLMQADDPSTVAAPSSPSPNNVFDDIALAHREIYTLYEIAQSMGTSVGLADTMALIAGKLASLVPYSCAALFLHDVKTDTLQCRFATGVDAELIQRISVPNGEGVTGSVARNRRSVLNARPSADLEAAGLASMTTRLQSALICPLVVRDTLIGTLAVYHVEPLVYSDDLRRLLERVTEQASGVIHNALEFDRTREDSLTDSLTGLPNLRNLSIHFGRELARAQRLNSEVALLVMDLDHFKDINDIHGHHVGDGALREVARVLLAAIRPYDICVRYAGDEFIIVLSGCGAEEAEHKLVELRRAIEDVVFETRPGKRVPLGISAGAAVFPRDGESYESLLASADSRMYQDKACRKRQGFRGAQGESFETLRLPELTDNDLHRAASGIL